MPEAPGDLQNTPVPWQSLSDEHEALQAVVLAQITPPGHAVMAPVAQVPEPLHSEPVICPLLHDAVPHAVPLG